jgi:hypothetical protein
VQAPSAVSARCFVSCISLDRSCQSRKLSGASRAKASKTSCRLQGGSFRLQPLCRAILLVPQRFLHQRAERFRPAFTCAHTWMHR